MVEREAPGVEPRHLVEIGTSRYEEAALVAATNTVALERLEQGINAVKTPRELFRFLRGLKQKGVHRFVLAEALRRVVASGPVENPQDGIVVASFPAPPPEDTMKALRSA